MSCLRLCASVAVLWAFSAEEGLSAQVASAPDAGTTGVSTGDRCDYPQFRASPTLTGEVRDLLTERPMPGVQVEMRSTEYGQVDLANATTDASGKYRFCGVPAIAGVMVQANADGMRSPATTLASGEDPWHETLYIRWSVPIDLAGVVVDGETGDPIAGASVTVAGRGARSTTDASGAFRIEGQGAGSVRLRTTALGYATRSDTLSTVSGDQLDLRILMGAEAIALEPILVRARATTEFEELTTGSRFDVLTRAEVDSILPRVMGFNSLLRNARFPGVIVTERTNGTVCVQAHRAGASLSGGCAMVEVFLDGVRLFHPESVLSNLAPSIVESMRFMDAVEASVRYTGPRIGNGVLLIETRRGS